MSAPKPGNANLKIVGCVLAGTGLAILLYRSIRRIHSNDPDLPRNIVINVLKEFRRDLYPIFKQMSNYARVLKSEIKKKVQEGKLSESAIQNVPKSVEGNQEFKDRIAEIEDRVYVRYNIQDRKDFEKYCKKLQKTDPEVKFLMGEIQSLFWQAKIGESLHLSINIPDDISENTALKTTIEIFQEQLRLLMAKTREMNERGSKMTDAETREKQKMEEEAIESILIRNGFNAIDDIHPQGLYTNTLHKFSRENAEFRRNLSLIEQLNATLVKEVEERKKSFAELEFEINDMGKFIVKNESFRDYFTPDRKDSSERILGSETFEKTKEIPEAKKMTQ